MDATDPRYRAGIQNAYRDHIIRTLGWKIPAVQSAEELIELAKKCADPPLEAENGWHTEPPFPGAVETPEKSPGGWRMIAASRLLEGEKHIATLFVTFYSGRTVSVVCQVPLFPIPEEYSPVISQ